MERKPILKIINIAPNEKNETTLLSSTLKVEESQVILFSHLGQCFLSYGHHIPNFHTIWEMVHIQYLNFVVILIRGIYFRF